jgi:large subunit ribosomal protein L15
MVRKTQKFRGSRTHGRGKKAGRGAGKHGGHGNAGLHKHRYIQMLKFDPDHFGRHGFKRPQCSVISKFTINVSDVERELSKWVAAGKAKSEGGAFVVDLGALDYDKLLGSGRVTKKLKLTVSEASETAVEKVKKAGGEVMLPKKEPEAPKKKSE